MLLRPDQNYTQGFARRSVDQASEEPLLMVNEEDVEDVLLSDDGTGIDLKRRPRLPVQTLIARAEFTQIAIRDEGVLLDS